MCICLKETSVLVSFQSLKSFKLCILRLCGKCSNAQNNYKFPYHVYDVARPHVAATKDMWEPIDRFHACEINNENIQSIVDLQVNSLQRCKVLCQTARHCQAIDWFNSSNWCSLYKKPCINPLQGKHGGSSYRMIGGFIRVYNNKFLRD